MANRHFAKLADVWKHLPLVEVLSIERPRRYWESHAGSAVYEMADDAERRYGALTFIEVAALQPALAPLSLSGAPALDARTLGAVGVLSRITHAGGARARLDVLVRVL